MGGALTFYGFLWTSMTYNFISRSVIVVNVHAYTIFKSITINSIFVSSLTLRIP